MPVRTSTGKLQQVRAHAATNLEQACATIFVKPHHTRHPWRVLLITITLDVIKKLTSAEFVLAIVLSATRILAPLLSRTNFFFSQRGHFTSALSSLGRHYPGTAGVSPATHDSARYIPVQARRLRSQDTRRPKFK